MKFHHDDPNKLISGSVDGLINLYDLSQNNEEDALIDSLNTESSVEKLRWLQHQGKDIVGCITHTADVQLWRTDDAQPYCHLHRAEIAKATKVSVKKPSHKLFYSKISEKVRGAHLCGGYLCNHQQSTCFGWFELL